MSDDKNLIISNREKFAEIIFALAKDGKDKLHIIADFDQTLTKAFVRGSKTPSLIALLRDNQALSPDYAPRAYALYDKYSLYEKNAALTLSERSNKMLIWWNEHHKLLLECGLTRQAMDKVMAKKQMRLRKGAIDFLKNLRDNKIPFIVMSAGPAYMITKFLELNDCLHENIQIIANRYKFDDSGRVSGFGKPVIHSLNKHEVVLKKNPVYKTIKKRKNIILLGNTLDDVGMVKGFPCKQLLKIGFLNEEIDKYLPVYKKFFDMVIAGDGNFAPINNLMSKIYGRDLKSNRNSLP